MMTVMQMKFGNNPLFQKAMQMAQVNSVNDLPNVVKNVAKQKNISEDQLRSIASQFGISL
jgi:hypothetical protein